LAPSPSGSPDAAFAAGAGTPDADAEEDGEPGDGACPVCGHATLIELLDAPKLLGGLNQLTAVSAVVCPACGALSGEVEDPRKIPIGPEHGTALRRVPEGEDQEALEEPAEHDG
jgi:YgiT-type zinc finger domain-containing protein